MPTIKPTDIHAFIYNCTNEPLLRGFKMAIDQRLGEMEQEKQREAQMSLMLAQAGRTGTGTSEGDVVADTTTESDRPGTPSRHPASLGTPKPGLTTQDVYKPI